jgi:hypothetical protein
MKRVLVLLAVTLSSAASVLPQTARSGEGNDGFVNAFEADSVVWSYIVSESCHGGPSILYKTILYGDTVIDDIKWKIVTDIFYYPSKGLVRTDEKKVIFRGYPGYDYADEEITIYDFSFNAGDSLLIHQEYYQANKKEILEIDSVVLGDGKKHKRMIYHFDVTEGAIEGMGFSGSHPFYSLISLPTCASGPYLTCCEVNGELLYKNPLFADCNGSWVSNETVSGVSRKARVSFSDGQLRVAFDDETPFDVELYNMQGMMLMQKKNNRSEMTVGLDNLPQGIYAVRVQAGSYVYSEKIVK